MSYITLLGLKQSRLLIRNARNVTSIAENKDFYGISHITSKDIAGAFASTSKLPHEKISNKYEPLLQKRSEPANKEYELDSRFGSIRFDADNVPTKHGQYEKSNDAVMYQTNDIKEMFSTSREQSSVDSEIIIEQTVKVPSVPGYRPAYKIVDVLPDESIANVLKQFNKIVTQEDNIEEVSKNQPPLTFRFVRAINSTESTPQSEKVASIETSSKVQNKLSGKLLEGEELEEVIMESTLMPETNQTVDYDPEMDQVPLHELDPTTEEYHIRNEKIMRDFHQFDVSAEKKHAEELSREPESIGALHYLKQVRAQRIEPTAKGLKHRLKEDNPYSFRPSIKLDSQGFRIYTNQVPDWNSIIHSDILNYIKSNIVYRNYDLLAVNKPYGIASHSEDDDKNSLDMNRLITEVAKKYFHLDKVYLAHRLDKTTTGVLLFSTTPERARSLQKLFKSDQIKKTYWCITSGVPDPPAGIIDIPIGEYVVGGKARSCLAPVYVSGPSQLTKKYREAKRAITEYRLIEQGRQCALVEVKPRSGVKHQIRVHMSFGLNKPILGDHKYSDAGKVAPQRLPVPMLKALHLRQQKVRTLPIHLHAKTIVIPGAKANGETLFIRAPLPAHFVENMKSLGLLTDQIRDDIK